MRSAFQTPRLAEMVPFGLHDAPCQTPHAALCHGRLSQNRRNKKDRLPLDSFERVSAASTPWGMDCYRLQQPPARFALIAERDHYPTGRAPALPGRTGEFGAGCGSRTRVNSRRKRPRQHGFLTSEFGSGMPTRTAPSGL
jgi:hypothetical protein